MKKFNVLITERNNKRYAIISLNSTFGISTFAVVCNRSELSFPITVLLIPDHFDHSDIALMCYNELCKLGYGDDFEFDIFYKNDNIRVYDGNIQDRIFEVRPQYVDDCTISGDLISETDSVQFEVRHPNGTTRNTICDRCDNMEQLQQALLNHGYVDNNCSVEIYNEECYAFDIRNGQIISPATIVNKE